MAVLSDEDDDDEFDVDVAVTERVDRLQAVAENP